MGIYQHLFYSPSVDVLLSDETFIRKMLETEAALANAQAVCGVVPEKSAKSITSCCVLFRIDLASLKAGVALAGNAAIPLVKQLYQLLKSEDPEAVPYLHYGATSQDIIDTATVLLIKDFVYWIETRYQGLNAVLLELTKNHRNTVMMGRTLLQQAKPITFGLKTAFWLEGLREFYHQLQDSKKRVLKIQLAGAIGGANGFIPSKVRKEMARSLGLLDAPCWHTHRGALVEFATTLGILNGHLGKIAKDVSLLMQTEIAEVMEGLETGKGTSSTMPHKRNPVTCAAILANAARTPHLVSTLMAAMPQENERSAGLWHSEWEPLLELMRLTGGTMERALDLLVGLEVDKDKMKNNLEITRGLVYAENVALALAEKMGKLQAHELVEKACKDAVMQNKQLYEVLKTLNIDLPDLEKYFDPAYGLEHTFSIIDEILNKHAL